MRQSLTFLGLLFTLALTAQTERITDFSAVMEVRSDGSIEMTETVSVVATGDIIKRGITRAITIEPIGEGKKGAFDYELISATRNGEAIEPFSNKGGRVKTFYLGSKDETLPPGAYTYVFTYASEDQIYFMEYIDEIRWHLIDTDGQLPVERASMEIRFPGGTNILGADCYAGREGTADDACTVTTDRNKATFVATQPLAVGEGMTVSVSAPKGTFARPAPPTPLEENGTLYVMALGLAGAFLYGLFSWMKHGRDPKGPEVAYEYYPPENVSPASAHYLLYGLSSPYALTASLTDLATKNYLLIEERKKPQLLFGDKEYFALLESAPPAPVTTLPKEQQALLEGVFAKTKLVELDGDYDKTLGKAASAHARSLKKEHKSFLADGKNWNRVLPLGGIFLVMLIGAILFTRNAAESGFIAMAVGIPVFLIGMVFYAWLIHQPSWEKVALKNQLKGLRKYLKLSRKKRDALVDAPEMTQAYFERLLPYAIVFGQDNDWAADLATDWARTSERGDGRQAFFFGGFASQFNQSFSGTAYQASSGGGGSYSGGGGSVGGGGGGTGGF